jgi:hypothetical protein
MVRKLIEYNADVNAQNRIGWTPLHIASRLVQPNIDVVQLLLERGVDVNARAKDGCTALHEASAYGTPEIVRLLLEHGANVEMKNNNGRTPHQTMSGTPRDKARKWTLLKELSVQGIVRTSRILRSDHSLAPRVAHSHAPTTTTRFARISTTCRPVPTNTTSHSAPTSTSTNCRSAPINTTSRSAPTSTSTNCRSAPISTTYRSLPTTTTPRSRA